MSHIYGSWGPRFPRLGALTARLHLAAARPVLARRGIYDAASAYARNCGNRFRERLARGETVYLLGVSPAGHNSGAALIEVSRGGVRLICNEEEERYTGVKHCAAYPRLAVDAVRERLADLGARPDQLHACLATWDYGSFFANGVRLAIEHAPQSLHLLSPASSPKFNFLHVMQASAAPRLLAQQLGVRGSIPVIALRHHDNHAWFSFAASPFGRSSEPVLVTVIDGYGDDGSLSVYLARAGQMTLLRANNSIVDSLGGLYSAISSTQGGWTTLSSEGRYMGAAAWGDGNRLTNRYYGPLRELIHLAGDGEVRINRRMIGWHLYGERRPCNRALREVLGDPVPSDRLWNPDAVLNVDDIEHSEVTRDRVDKAAATQLVFEDALFHVVAHFVRRTGARRLVLTGGTALNCVANMRLLDAFDPAFYERHVGTEGPLHLWVPPTPGDAGVPIGAAYNFALTNGAGTGDPLRHAFYCGQAPSDAAIGRALDSAGDIGSIALGSAASADGRTRIGDFAAYVLARGGVLGLFQGPAETGPRALGHRSVLANPCDPHVRDTINARVKLRERIRPLAPMATLDAARRCFELSDGASDDDYNAYNYMVLTVRATAETRRRMPAIVHQDGTSRIQIVREDVDPFTYTLLRAMGRRVGVEIAVNTSLNVGSPIAQTPAQAIDVLRRARALTGLLLLGAEGHAWLAWHNVVEGMKDGGRELLGWQAAYDWNAEPLIRS
jgi:carbamoyltransferase